MWPWLVCLLVAGACGGGDKRPTRGGYGDNRLIGQFVPDTFSLDPRAGLSDTAREVLEGVTFVHGDVVVPERYPHNANDGRSLVIPVVCARVGDPNNAPVFWVEGGPGASSLNRAGAFTARLLFRQSFPGRDLCFYDQRGTGRSLPKIECADALRVPDEDTVDARAVAQACRQELDRADIDVGAFNPVEGAQDLNVLREALREAFDAPGYDKLVPYGTSYGSMIATQAMRLFPEQVDAAVLDGVVPAGDVNWVADTSDASFRGIRAVTAACGQDRNCRDTFGDVSLLFDLIVTGLQQEPLSDEDGEVMFDGLSFVDTITAMIDGRRADIVPRFIDALINPNTDLDATIADLFGDEPLPEDTEVIDEDQVNFITFFLMACAHVGSFSREAVPVTNITPAIRRPLVETMMFSGDFCAGLNTPRIPDQARQPFAPATRFMLLSGQFDLRTPADYGVIAGQALGALPPSPRNLFVPAGGHVVVFDDCIDEVTRSFLGSDSGTPNAQCLTRLRPSFDTTQSPLERTSTYALPDGSTSTTATAKGTRDGNIDRDGLRSIVEQLPHTDRSIVPYKGLVLRSK